MNRNIVLIIVLLIAGAVTYYAWKTKKDPINSPGRTESNFKIEDVSIIHRIVITNKEGIRSELKRTGDHWLVNGIHRARQSNIDHLLRGIKNQHLEHIPTKAATENILSSMAVNGIHVEIFDASDKKISGYYIGGVTSDERSTYFLKEGSSQPYGLEDPGFDGSLRSRYALRPTDWRDVRFWVEENDKIDTLKVHYPKQRQHSFIIYKDGREYGVVPMFATTARKENVNQQLINSYLISLSKIASETFLPDSPQKDSVVQSVPFLELQMIYPDKSSYLKFFAIDQVIKPEFSTDIPMYFIDYNGKDFMIGQYDVVKGAFRSYEYFYQ